MAQSNKRFQYIANSAPVGIGISKVDGHVLFANGALIELFQFESNEQLISNGGFLRFKNSKDLNRLIDKVISDGKIEQLESEMITNKGEKLTVLLTAVLAEDEIHWIFMNISDRKKLEKAVKKYNRELNTINEELEAFTYSVSHDLRTPLRSLSGFSQLLLKKPEIILEEKGKDYLSRINQASQTMGQLIDDLLSLSRISRSKLNPTTVDLTGMVKKINKSLQANYRKRKVHLEVMNNISCTADENLIYIALQNLLENAWKYSKNNPNTIIEFGKLNRNNEEILFIRDNGAGFNMQYYNKLFDPFQRLHGTSEFKGTGIGLSIVQRIIKRHGGKIWAESEEQKGTTFYFTINTSD